MAAHPKPLGSVFDCGNGSATAKSRVARERTPSRLPIPASKAKAHLLQLLDEVERDRIPITITKRGRVVAQIVPAAPETKVSAFDQMFGRTSGWM
jgi:prevent-host-death family protein